MLSNTKIPLSAVLTGERARDFVALLASCMLFVNRLVITLYELKKTIDNAAIEDFLRTATQETGVLLLGGIQQGGARGTG